MNVLAGQLGPFARSMRPVGLGAASDPAFQLAGRSLQGLNLCDPANAGVISVFQQAANTAIGAGLRTDGYYDTATAGALSTVLGSAAPASCDAGGGGGGSGGGGGGTTDPNLEQSARNLLGVDPCASWNKNFVSAFQIDAIGSTDPTMRSLLAGMQTLRTDGVYDAATSVLLSAATGTQAPAACTAPAPAPRTTDANLASAAQGVLNQANVCQPGGNLAVAVFQIAVNQTTDTNISGSLKGVAIRQDGFYDATTAFLLGAVAGGTVPQACDAVTKTSGPPAAPASSNTGLIIAGAAVLLFGGIWYATR